MACRTFWACMTSNFLCPITCILRFILQSFLFLSFFLSSSSYSFFFLFFFFFFFFVCFCFCFLFFPFYFFFSFLFFFFFFFYFFFFFFFFVCVFVFVFWLNVLWIEVTDRILIVSRTFMQLPYSNGSKSYSNTSFLYHMYESLLVVPSPWANYLSKKWNLQALRNNEENFMWEGGISLTSYLFKVFTLLVMDYILWSYLTL